MKALLQYRASPGFRRALEQVIPRSWTLAIVEEDDAQGFAREIPDTTVLLHCLEPVTDEVLEAASELRLIQKIGVGINTIDVESAKRRGIAVANMPGTNTRAVVEHTLALMLAVLRRLLPVDSAVRAGEGWALEGELVDSMGEIGGRRVGLVGFGAVASRLAPVLDALGAELQYTSREAKPDAPAFARWSELDALVESSDIVSLHLPLTPETAGMMSAERIARMKPGAILINTARGGLVDSDALADALGRGALRGAGLDVFPEEPVDPDHPLLSLPNVVCAPHVAWLTAETLERSARVIADNLLRLERGETLLHRVA